MKKKTLFLVYLLISSYLNVSFVSVSHVVQAQEIHLFQNNFNNSLKIAKWNENVVKDKNSFSENSEESYFVTYGHMVWDYGNNALRSTRFKLLIGEYDASPYYSHMYFDDIAVEYSPEEPAGEELQITILSPEERIYNTATIDLNVTANKPVDEWRYSLNGGENVTFEPNTTITAQDGENFLVVYALAGDERADARVNFYVNASEEDTTPPGTVENLTHEVGMDYIHWTWDNPPDEDFETALVYIDGSFQGETDEGEWWLEELGPGETHTIGILTQDYSGNVNTTWVNDTATTLTPAETVYVNESGWWYEDGEFNPSKTPLQDGVDAAAKRGTVIVLAGTYPESVGIDKPLTVETSESARVTGDGFEWEKGKKPVFYISSDNVTLNGFVIASSVSNIGVWLDGVENCTVEDNTITITETEESERYGIYLSEGGNHVIRNNEVSVSGFQGVGIYIYETKMESSVYGNTVTVRGDSADGIEVFYSTASVHDNTVSIAGVSANLGYALYLYLAGNSSVDNNELTTNLSETNAWAIGLIAEFKGSLSGNTINGIRTEIVCPENCLVRGVLPENRPAPPEGYGDVEEYLEIDADSWLHLGLYYDDSALEGLREDNLQIWRFSEGWTLDGTSEHHLDTNKNLVEANLTQFSIFTPLAQEETDITPPILTFVEPTPEDGELIDDSNVIINVTSNEDLGWAILEFDGVNHTMLGSGRNWYYPTSTPDGTHTFMVYAGDLAGNNGTSEERSFEVDTKAPEYSNAGQDVEGVPPGGELHVHAFWSDPHLTSAILETNATEGAAWDTVDEIFFEETEGWSNFTISTNGLEPGLYCWQITGKDTLNHKNTTPLKCFQVYAPPEIVSYSPESPVESYVGDVVEFSVTADQVVNITWYLDGNVVKTEEDTYNSTYVNSNVSEGEHSVKVVVENSNGSASQFWAWYVYSQPNFVVSFVEPTPENGAMLNVRSITINISSSLDLDNATLEWNDTNESMSGSGRSWWIIKENLADGAYTFRVYGFTGGITNHTEERSIEIDATAPQLLEYGQSEDVVTVNESVEVYARWSDWHLDGAVLMTNATFVDGAFVWSEIPLEIVNSWSNWTINTDENFAGKVFCWYITANDTFGNEKGTPQLCFYVEENLRIISFSPEGNEIEVWDNESVNFSIELNKAANVTWFVNDTEVLVEEGTHSEYHNDTLIPGVWNVTAIARRDERTVSHSWKLTVKTDTTPPVLTFLPPTPENGSLVGDSLIVFNLTSNEKLSQATLYFDRTAYPMEGSGKEWTVSLRVSDGNHEFYATGRDMHGNEGMTGTKVFEIDTTPPSYISYGQEGDSVLQGEDVKVYALWNESNPSIAKLKTNATESGEWITAATSEYSNWTNFTISTEGLSDGLYCWRIEAEDVLEHVNSTPSACFKVIEPLKIISFSPEGEEVEVFQNETAVFSVELNQMANITWLINGTVVSEEEGNESTYTNSSLILGPWNVSIKAENRNGLVRHWWLMRVNPPANEPPEIWFVPPTPANNSLLGTSRLIFNITASENLSSAVLELDGVNHTMKGSGKSWNLTIIVQDGRHIFRAYGIDLDGSVGSTETRTVETDTAPPVVHDQLVNLTLEWERDGIYSTHAERGLKAGLLINVTEPHPGHYDVYFNPDANDPNYGWVKLYSKNYTNEVPFFVQFNTSEPAYVMYYIEIYDALHHGTYGKYFFLRVRDTIPPAKIEVLTVVTFVGGAEVGWINPSDDDFNHTELWVDDRLIGNFSAAPGLWDGTILTLTPGETYNISVVPVDRYGNRGEVTWKSVTIPYPSLNAEYVPPTPADGAELSPNTSEITVKVSSDDKISACRIFWDGKIYHAPVSSQWVTWVDERGKAHSKLVYTCGRTFSGHLNGEHSFHAVISDGYGHFKSLPTRHIKVLWPCFEDCTLEITSPKDNVMSLLIPINFTMRTNAPPSNYTLIIENIKHMETFTPNVSYAWVDDHLSLNGSFLLDLSPFMKELREEGPRGEVLGLVITATDSCGRKIRAETEFFVCSGNERPELAVKVEDEVRPGEEVILHAEAEDKNGNLKGIYVSINGGEYMNYTEDMDISTYLESYTSNIVRVKAVDTCGAVTIKTFEVKVAGPPVQGDWLVNNTQLCSGRAYTVNGSLLITSAGSLELRNCKIHILGDGMEVNGTLKVLEDSLIYGERLSLTGNSGVITVDSSKLRGFNQGLVNKGKIMVGDSHLTGSFTFSNSDTILEDTEIEGYIKASGNLTVKRSIFQNGDGLVYEKPGYFSGGNLIITDSIFRNNEFGVKILGYVPNSELRNLTVENNNLCGICLEHSYHQSVNIKISNSRIIGNGEGIHARNFPVTIENSTIASNGRQNIWLDQRQSWSIVKNSNISGSDDAFRIIDVGSLIIENTNVSGDIRTPRRHIVFKVTAGKSTVLQNGEADYLLLKAYGELTVRSYSISAANYTEAVHVYPGGKLRVEDADGIPATDPIDRDASVLRDMGVLIDSGGEATIINSHLEDVSLFTGAINTMIRGCVIEAGRELSISPLDASDVPVTKAWVIEENDEWHYSLTEPSSDWVYTMSTDGMSQGSGPFAASLYKSHFQSGTEVGEFTDLYLKKILTFERIPAKAVLSYYAISGVEIYVNGRKVVDMLDHNASLSFVYGWGGGGISAHPLMGLVDVSGYLRTGKNVIAVHVRSPNRYPYLQLGAFKAKMYTVEGFSAIRDSRIRGNIYGWNARLLIANDEVRGDINLYGSSTVNITDSVIHGGVEVGEALGIEKSKLYGPGRNVTKLNFGAYAKRLSVKDSLIDGFMWGAYSTGNLTVNGSEIRNNAEGVFVKNGEIKVINSYITGNGVGIETRNSSGEIYNSLIHSNDVGIEGSTSAGNSLLVEHNTIIGNTQGIFMKGDGEFHIFKNLIQNNDVGIKIIGAWVELANDSIVNEKGIYVSAGSSGMLPKKLSFGDHVPILVENYTGARLYTKDGKVSENYDILDYTWGFALSPGEVVDPDPNWGSSLLSASISVYPEENGEVSGVITVAGRASADKGISRVRYSLIYRGNETVIGDFSVNTNSYSDFLTLDTIGMNLTGRGVLKITAWTSRGGNITSTRTVYFSNAEIKIVNYSVSHPTAVYVYRRDPNVFGTAMPYDERFVNVSVTLENTGPLDGVAKIELVLPEYIERHTGRISLLVAIPAGMKGDFHALIPITVYDPITLTWDPLPEELPQDGTIPMDIRVYDMDGMLRDESYTTINFDLGPVFKLVKYEPIVYTRYWCQRNKNLCHKKNLGVSTYTYDGDGDGNLEAAESHHFNIIIENIGDREVYLKFLNVRDNIPERDPLFKNKLLKHNSVSIGTSSDYVFMVDVTSKNLTRLIKPGEKRWVYGAWMDWWYDNPPKHIPPVNYAGNYLSNVLVYYYNFENGQPHEGYYITPTINYVETPVKALNKTFVPFTEFVGPVQVDVVGIKDDKTYLRLKNTNENVYYSYYAEGMFDPSPEGYLWYHVIPPSFEFKAIVGNSKEPGTVVPHYRVTVGVEHSLLFNEIQLIAIGAEGALGVYDIDVPVETIVMALAKALLKMINIAETLDFPSDQTIAEYSQSASAVQTNQMLANDNTTIVPLTLDDFARWENKYGMNKDYYYKLTHFDEIPLDQELNVTGKFLKAVVTDEELQILFIETVLEVIDNDDLKDLYAVIQDLKKGYTLAQELQNTNNTASADRLAEEEALQNIMDEYGFSEEDLDDFNDIIKEALVDYVKEEIKKRKSFQELDPKKQKEALDKAGGSVAAAIDTFEKMSEWAVYNVIAILTQPYPLDISVLDPPANYTVEAEKMDRAIILGGSSGNLEGWGNVSLSFDKTDVYKAEYIVPTPLTKVSSIFNGTLRKMTININGTRKGDDIMGVVRIEMKPDPRNASMVFAVFRNEAFARAFLSSYFTRIDSFSSKIANGTIVLKAEGALLTMPEDVEVSISLSFGELFTNATIERRGHYRGTIELKPAFGIDSKNVKTTIGGKGIETSSYTIKGKEVVVAVPKNETIKPPEIALRPTTVYEGGRPMIETTKPCSLSWELANISGYGAFVETSGLKSGNYTLQVSCVYGNLTTDESFTLEILPKPTVRKKADGEEVTAEKNERVRIVTGTDLYRIYFTSKERLSGMVAVYQGPGKAEAPKGYKYITYALFNVTHPTNWSVENVTIKFRISKEWMKENNVSREDILLLHYEGIWKEYKPTFEYEDLRYVYYRVSVPSLSVFAVAEKVKVEEHETPTETPVHTESPAETPAPEGGNTTYYILAVLAVLALIGIYVYRRR